MVDNLHLLTFPAENVIYIYEYLLSKNIQTIIDGGWAVDAVVGKQTRIHSDLDLIISIDKIDLVKSVLLEVGFFVNKEETEIPNRLVMVDEEKKLVIDFHLVEFSKDGSGIQKLTNGIYFYSKEGLSGFGKIFDKKVRCLSVGEQIRCRKEKNYSFKDYDRFRNGGINADLHDLNILEMYY